MIASLLVNAAALVGLMAALWLVAVRVKDVSFIDAVWGGGMAFLAALTWLQVPEPGMRGGLIAVMTIIWGTRLAIHLLTRWRAQGGA